ncbi:MAG: transglycosylase domain-containing protein, partial [bacterium]|nr:transglycosylase domain-containing protein [bacterium]
MSGSKPAREFSDLARNFWLIRKRPWVPKFVILCLILILIFGSGFFYYLYFYDGDLTDASGRPLDWNKLGRRDYKRASYVYAADGRQIGMFFYEIRDPVKLNEVPTLLANGFIAAEDKRFYSHHGIDYLATLRALTINFFHKVGFRYGSKSGASGISQQEARLLYADEVVEFRTREHSYSRKLKEAKVAIRLERKYPKEKIFEGFLNNVYFGHGVNGVAEAARFYFGKDLRRDTLGPREVAILVSLNKSSQKYCPIFHEPKKTEPGPGASKTEIEEVSKAYKKALAEESVRITLARERYNWVLGRMFREGFLNASEYEQALFTKDDPLELALLHVTPLNNNEFGYGNRIVKDELLVGGFSEDMISHHGGLRVRTSYDTEIQKIAVEELTRQLTELNRERKDGEEKLEGAIVVIENKTGRVVALSGGHDFRETQFNRVLSLRSAGSVFKPFVYAAGFEFYGKTLEDKICNCPFRMPEQIDARGKVLKWWSPKNFEEKNPAPSGFIPLPTGLIRSVNLATLNLAKDIGIDSVIAMAHKTGVWGHRNVLADPDGNIWFRRPGVNTKDGGLEPYLPTAIGASDVSLLELTSAFSTFARGGTYIQPTIILKVEDAEGGILYQAPEVAEKRVLSESTALLTTILLRAVTKIGTAKISMRDIDQQVAVKTGTSNGPYDLSMIGYTPEYTIGIRIGYDAPKVIAVPEYMKRVGGDPKMQVSGGWVAGPVFRKVVDRIYEDRPKV